jgi:O-antigen/teichoic acid export membrane protein
MIHKFFRDSAIYTIPSILSYGISFFLIPLYTRVLTPTDYGALDMITVFSSLIALTVALEVSQAVARFYQEEQTIDGKKDLASTALWFTVSMFTVFLLVALAFAPELSLIVIGAPGFDDVFHLGVVFVWLSGLFYLLKSQLRFELRSKAYSMVSIAHSLMTAGASVLLAYVFQLGINGFLAGMIIGTAAGILLGFYYLKTTFRLRFDFTKLKMMLAFSTPLVPSSIAVFVSMYIDRLMINYYLSLEEVGLYGIGYRLASVSTIVLVGFQMALTPLVYKHYQEPETPRQLATIFRTFLAIVIVIFLIISLFADVALMFLTTPAYYAASQVVVFLVPAILLSQMYIFAPGIGIAKKTHLFIWINAGGAILNTVFNWMLIPQVGYVGAGIATLMGYACVFGAYMYCSQKLYYVPHNWRAIAGAVLVAAALVTIGLQFHFGLYIDMLVRGSLILLMPGVFLFLGILNWEEMVHVRDFLPARWNQR